MKMILRWVSQSGVCISISYVVFEGGDAKFSSRLLNKDYFEVCLEAGMYDGLASKISMHEIFCSEYLAKKDMLSRFGDAIKNHKISQLDFYDENSVRDFCGDGGAPSYILKKFKSDIDSEGYKILPYEFLKNMDEFSEGFRADDFTLMRAAKKAKDLVDCIAPKINAEDDAFFAFNEFRRVVESASWCLPAIVKTVRISALEKYPATLGAPFYCSQKFPWPESDGEVCSPLFQFPLEIFRLLSGYSGPGEVVQCFMSQYVDIRIIDNIEGMIVSAPKSVVDEIKYYREGSNVDVVTGFGVPKFNLGTIHYRLADEISHLLTDEEGLFLRMLSMISYKAESIPVKFLGAYGSIQKDQSGLGKCLFSITDERVMNLGDSGGAQVFISKDGDLGAEFSCR